MEIGEGDGGAAGADLAEPLQPARIAREQRHARFVLARGDVLHRNVLDDHGCDAVDQPGASDGVGDPVRVPLREVPRTRGAARIGGELGVRAFRRDHLVGATERGDRGGADRLAHGVAGRERGGDDCRAEHRAGDDQCTPPRPAADVPDAEPQKDAVAERQRCDRAEHDDEQDGKNSRQRADRDTEELAHGSSPQPIVTQGASASATS